MDRNRLLSEWKRYPTAPKGCQSLVRWQKQPGWVGGRVVIEDGQFFLHSEPALSLRVEAKGLIEGLQSGDHVAVELTGQNSDSSWNASRLMLLAPAESLYMTEMNLQWRPFLQAVRTFFIQRNFIEIETPSLVICPGLEPALEPFGTDLQLGSDFEKRFLPTSPEIHLKKALCAGVTDLFEIKTCFRNGEISEHHQPEFHMLEWYRAYSDLESIIEDLSELSKQFGAAAPRVTTFRELFQEHLQVDLKPTTDRATYWQWCMQQNLHPDESDTLPDLFHRIWIDRIEPQLSAPTIVRDFPPSMAALARLKEDGWADRFEFFWNGMEIANAFHEVNDPEEQKKRWEIEQLERSRLKHSLLDVDENLLLRMKSHGLPPTGGIALGLERLFMAAYNISDIRSLRLFPYR